MGKYHELAKEIVENVGGKENILGLVHCIAQRRNKNPESFWIGLSMRYPASSSPFWGLWLPAVC